MNKEEFLTELKNVLSGLPQDDARERLAFYDEMIDDRIEEGASEQDAVASVGSVEKIVKDIVSDIPLTKLVKVKIKPKRTLNAWEIVLIVLGFPLWFPLLVAAGAVIFSLYVVALSLIISLWAVEISLLAGAIGGVAAAAVYIIQGSIIPFLAILGAGIFCAGISVFAFYACVLASKGIFGLTKNALLGFKTRLVRKENAK